MNYMSYNIMRIFHNICRFSKIQKFYQKILWRKLQSFIKKTPMIFLNAWAWFQSYSTTLSQGLHLIGCSLQNPCGMSACTCKCVAHVSYEEALCAHYQAINCQTIHNKLSGKVAEITSIKFSPGQSPIVCYSHPVNLMTVQSCGVCQSLGLSY